MGLPARSVENHAGRRKTGISGRNTEKLKTLNAQQADWLRFVKGSFF